MITNPENRSENGEEKDSTISSNSLLSNISGSIHQPETEFGKFEYLRIRDTTPILPVVPIITINGEIITTEGNITTISGESKCGKTGFASILISGALSKGGIV